ncbi:ATP-dependent DNA helicase DinG [Granulicatella balaenopterae]|uniref:3'-5' exonuclease DinG n=1 Tax=Granulicatella balaenopterae TaxID=137733 RepID=A0A1H9K069_9LACT|nr:helicase C-terminal domain-containing protein [Granulicatella balaenopterae]SEQ92303.1 ATP-dependent DNA helicase DinG [Granulicatella balaenopterae]
MKQIYAVVDIETTGPKFESGDRIIQLGCTLIENKKIVAEYSFDINPGRSIPSSISKLTGITNEQVVDAPYFEDIAPTIESLLEGAVFVAHNIGFDYPFLVKSFDELAGTTYEARGIDTVQLAQILLPTQASYRLSDLSQDLGLRHEHAHSAGSDAYATAELLLQLLTIINELPLVTLEKCLPYSDYLIGDTGALFEVAFEKQKKAKRPLNKQLVIVDGIAIKQPQIVQKSLSDNTEDVTALDLYKRLQCQRKLHFRAEQFELLQQLSEEFGESDQKVVFYEASTGVGKTMAYLLASLPLVFTNHQIWISSSTLLLQEQLLEQEIKPICEQLGLEVPICSLKGQSHFVKLDKMSRLLKEEPFTITQRTAISVMGLLVWLTQTTTGDITECNRAIYHPEVWEFITQRSIDKDGKLLPVSEYDFYQRLVQEVAISSIVVTNHAYLYQHSCLTKDLVAETNLKKVLIIDECHKLDSVVQQATTQVFSLKYLNILQEQLMEEQFQRMTPLDFNELPVGLYKVNQLLTTLMMIHQEIIAHLEDILVKHEDSYLMTHKEWENSPISGDFSQMLSLANEIEEVLEEDKRLVTPSSKHYLNEVLMQRLTNYLAKLVRFCQILEGQDGKAYFGLTLTKMTENMAYVTVEVLHLPTDELVQMMAPFMKTIGISATIPRHSLLLENSGLHFPIISMDKALHPEDKSRIYFINDAPTPNFRQPMRYANHLAGAIVDIVEVTEGRVLVLLSSKEILELVYQQLTSYKEFKRTVLAQGITANNRKLQRRYAADEKAVLLGLSSFWEGFDMGNIPISQVIITKLPFSNPSSLQEQLTKKAVNQAKNNYFKSYALPQMLQSLKQGIGRMRYDKHQHKSAVWLLDSRSKTANYAQKIERDVSQYMDIYQANLEECLVAQRYRKE